MAYSLQYPDKEVDKDIPTMMQPKRFIKNKQSVIKEIIEEGYNSERIAILEVYADYKTLKDVFIMKGD